MILTFEHHFVVEAPTSVVCAAAGDLELLTQCIPGASLNPEGEADGSRLGEIRVAVGPTRASFRGRARLEMDPTARKGRLLAEGSDRRGATKARATLSFHVEDADGGGSDTHIRSEIEFVGSLERFMGAAGNAVAEELMASFAERFAARVVELARGADGLTSAGAPRAPIATPAGARGEAEPRIRLLAILAAGLRHRLAAALGRLQPWRDAAGNGPAEGRAKLADNRER